MSGQAHFRVCDWPQFRSGRMRDPPLRPRVRHHYHVPARFRDAHAGLLAFFITKTLCATYVTTNNRVMEKRYL